jgi:hypothetical protein
VTYSTWVAGGLRVLDIYANHFEVLVVIKDQDVQARLALAARVSNQFFGCNMWTVNRSCDPTFFLGHVAFLAVHCVIGECAGQAEREDHAKQDI